MKKVFFIAVLLMFAAHMSFGQVVEKYNYAEIIVLQNSGKNKSVLKKIYLNSTTDTNLKTTDLKAITSNSDLFKFMDDRDWIFVERVLAQPTNSVPIWISYIFKKKI